MTRQSTQSPAPVGAFSPAQINSLDDTGLSPLWLQDLILKVLYFRGYMTGFKIAEEIASIFRRDRSIVHRVKTGKIDRSQILPGRTGWRRRIHLWNYRRWYPARA